MTVFYRSYYMFSHIMVGANNVTKSKRFYDAIMKTLGYEEGVIDDSGRCFYFSPESIFCITKPIDGEVATYGNGMTIGFKANSPEQVNAWHNAGTDNGGTTCENPPGIRDNGKSKYLAYLRDPDGNKLCAVYFM